MAATMAAAFASAGDLLLLAVATAATPAFAIGGSLSKPALVVPASPNLAHVVFFALASAGGATRRRA